MKKRYRKQRQKRGNRKLRRDRHSRKIARWLLETLLNHRHPESILADYEEIYHEMAEKKNRFMAGLWYWLQIIMVIPSTIHNSIFRSMIMF